MASPSPLDPAERIYLREFMAARFSMNDLHILAFDLSLDWDDIPHPILSIAIISLIEYFEARDQLACLMIQVIAHCPDERLASFLTSLTPCSGRAKIQIIVPYNFFIKPELRAQLTEMLRLAPDEVAIVGLLPGSTRILVGLPAKWADRLIATDPRLLPTLRAGPNRPDSRSRSHEPPFITSIIAYRDLPRRQQLLWRATADRALAYLFRNEGIFDAIDLIENPNERAAASAILASYLPERTRTPALLQALSGLSPAQRSAALAPLFPYLPEEDRSTLLHDAPRLARHLPGAFVVTSLAAQLPADSREQLLHHALDQVSSLPAANPQQTGRLLSALAPHLPESLFPQAIETAFGLSDLSVRLSALAALAPHVPATLREEFVTSALLSAAFIEDRAALAEALTILALRLPPPDCEPVAARALVAALSLPSGARRSLLLAALVPHLTEPLRQAIVADAVATALDDGSPLDQAAAFAELAPYAIGSVRRNLLRDALRVTGQIPNEPQRASALAALVPHLSEGLVIDAFDLARSLHDPDAQVHALAALAPHLPPTLLDLALHELDNDLHYLGLSEHALARASAALRRIGTPEAMRLLPDAERPQRHRP